MAVEEHELEASNGAEAKYAPVVVETGDGSHTLFIPELGEHYHSFHSSVREARHVYIEAGLRYIFGRFEGMIDVFELGFGTGLNALVTALSANDEARAVRYKSIELYPLTPGNCLQLNYSEHMAVSDARPTFEAIIAAPWQEVVAINAHFNLYKFQSDFLTYDAPESYFHLMFFDAFGFRAQEEMWKTSIFEKCFKMLKPGGALVTYASKGEVRRSMQAAGFEVAKLPGPPGKREMVRATRPY